MRGKCPIPGKIRCHRCPKRKKLCTYGRSIIREGLYDRLPAELGQKKERRNGLRTVLAKLSWGKYYYRGVNFIGGETE